MELTTGGWTFLVIAWIIIGGLCAYCMTKVLRSKQGGQDDSDS